MGETVDLSGRLRIELREPDGRVVERRVADNLITNAGRMFLAGLLGGHRQVQSLRIAVGTSNADPKLEDTQLGSQVAAAPAALNEPNQRQEAGRVVIVAQVTATLPPLPTAEPQAIQEAGIQIIGPDGSAVLYNHVTFPVVTRTGSLEMNLTWEVVF
ncbi:MAG TPA: hypothetical protein VJ779_03880 [Acetobacteraceae bacterium]|nr:hypothetical protein [Acetobacteraceae bacterium]